MRIDIATLFVEMCETVLSESIIGRARGAGHIEIYCHNIRDYSDDKHRRVDDAPFGGGMGMVMQADPTAAIAMLRRVSAKNRMSFICPLRVKNLHSKWRLNTLRWITSLFYADTTRVWTNA